MAGCKILQSWLHKNRFDGFLDNTFFPCLIFVLHYFFVCFSDDREKFLAWHSQQREKTFNFQRELEDYCKSNVTILRRCVLKFREIFMNVSWGINAYGEQVMAVDLLRKSLTIASACSLVFRKRFLQDKTLGIVPPNGYCRWEMQSVLALKYLMWTSTKENVQIFHKLNGGEVCVGRYLVDGMSADKKIIWEING